MLRRVWGEISVVNARRLALYAGLVVLLAPAGFALTWWGLVACAPPPLPGDELWTTRRTLAEAFGLMLRLGGGVCFTEQAAGMAALWLGAKTLGVLLVVLALVAMWET